MKNDSLTFTAHANITDSDIQQVARRIAMIVTGTEEAYVMADPPHRWDIGPSNNHWLGYDPSQKTFTLRFRYSPGDLALWAYRAVIVDALGLELWNPQDEAELSHLLQTQQ